MISKRLLQGALILAVLVSSFASAGSARAWGNCASYITVQWGDTLSGIAAFCGTSVDAIRAANPGLGWWVYAGQILYLPSGYNYYPPYLPPVSGGNYTVRWGDTLAKIAAANGITLKALLAANPQIRNPNLIYAGQVIAVPTGYNPPVYVPPYTPPPVVTPPAYPPPANFDGVLTVTARKGVNIRNQPSYAGKIVLADDHTKGRTFYYRTNSVTYDATYRRTWVEVVVSQTSTGYTTGWLPVSGPQDYLNHTGVIEDWVTPHIQ